MKHLIITISLALSFLMPNLVMAEATYHVLILKGDATIMKNGAKGWTKLKTGSPINRNDVIKIGNGAYLGLSHIVGGTTELCKEGVFSADSLHKVITQRKKNSFTRLFDFILKSASIDFSKTGKKENTIVAGTERGLVRNINVINPRNTFVPENQQSFIWKKSKDARSYIFELYSKMDVLLHKEELSDTVLTLDFNKLKLKMGDYYNWSIKLPGKEEVYGKSQFYLLEANKQNAIKDTLTEMMQVLDLKNSALDNAILGDFYHRNRITNKAMDCYNKAVELKPGVESFLMMRQNLKKEIDKKD